MEDNKEMLNIFSHSMLGSIESIKKASKVIYEKLIVIEEQLNIANLTSNSLSIDNAKIEKTYPKKTVGIISDIQNSQRTIVSYISEDIEDIQYVLKISTELSDECSDLYDQMIRKSVETQILNYNLIYDKLGSDLPDFSKELSLIQENLENSMLNSFVGETKEKIDELKKLIDKVIKEDGKKGVEDENHVEKMTSCNRLNVQYDETIVPLISDLVQSYHSFGKLQELAEQIINMQPSII